MKNLAKILFLVVLLASGLNQKVLAEDPKTVHLTIRSGDTVIFDQSVPLPIAGTIDMNDSTGTPHPLNADSVLSVISSADMSDSSWSITDLEYFTSFNAFYLKCIKSDAGNDCDNWQYVVNGSSSFSSMDQKILNGDENVYVYFGPQNRILLNSNSVSTNENLIVTAQNYDYENNNWTERTGVTIGLTQPNPSDAFNPIEVITSPVDENGQATFSSLAAGTYNVGVKEDYYFPTEPLTVSLAGSGGGSHGSSSSSTNTSKNSQNSSKGFDLNKAISFLISNQNTDGSFGEDIYTDWVAVSLSGLEKYNLNKGALKKYLSEENFNGDRLTDTERRVLALMASGINPYDVNGQDYIQKIVGSFDGTQFGDANEDNDDVFALLALINASIDAKNPMIVSDIHFILGKQKANGSWDESVDMTAAGIQALSYFKGTQEIDKALNMARQFLKQNQKEDGGWINTSSTAWAIGSIVSLGEKATDWKVEDGSTPLTFMNNAQETDGGTTGPSNINDENLLLKNRIWETAYAVSAMSQKSWNDIIPDYEKKTDGGSVLGATDVKPVAKKVPVKIKKEIKSEPVIETAPVVEEQEEPAPVEKSSWIMRVLKSIF